MRRVALGAGWAILLTVAAAAQAQVGGPVAVYLEPVEQRNVRQTVELPGTVEAVRQSIVGAETGGRVEHLLAEEGDFVAAGKPVFLAKPVAVDAPGCRSIAESGEKARGRLTFLVDFQTRAREVFREAALRVHRGDIGTPALGHVYYHGSGGDPVPKPEWGRDEARLRYWARDRVLSGDIIVEQNVHVLDMSNWLLGGHPVKARGMGGRKIRMKYGDCWDYFVITFWYPNEVVVDFSSAQYVRGYYDICARVYGSAGTVEEHYGLGPRYQVDPRNDGFVAITGDKPWKGSDRDDTFTAGAIDNVKAFIDSIRTGKYLNNAAESADSTLTCVLGRMAAYRGGTATWDEMMELNTKLEANLKL